MSNHRLAVVAAALVVAGACTEGADPGPTAPAAVAPSPASAGAAARRVDASGTFLAQVDFSTVSLTPRGRNCLLVIDGQLTFSGTIEGDAVGHTTALVFGPCEQVATTPPGTFRDVFRSELEFTGTIDGQPAQAHVMYSGGVETDGTIAGHLIFSNGVAGVLDADAVVAVGGSYHGAVVVGTTP
jgi:hypothetical protein